MLVTANRMVIVKNDVVLSNYFRYKPLSLKVQYVECVSTKVYLANFNIENLDVERIYVKEK